MDRLACMQSFVRAVELNSFSAVAREQQTTQPTISKQIVALEKYLGVQLLIRSTTNLCLTEEGKIYYQYCQQILETVTEAEANLRGKEEAKGTLRIGCSVLFGQMQIVPRLNTFIKYYPDLKINLVMADHFVNMVEQGLDVLIRIGDRQDNSLISHHIGTTHRITIATKDYFDQAGEPQTPEDLVNHHCIVYSNLATGNEWHFQGKDGLIKVQVAGYFQTDSSIAIRSAILSGLGIAVAPVWMFGDKIYENDLQIVLQDYPPTSFPINAVYRRSRFYPAKINCFINFLKSEFKLDPWV
ncbi:LysR family transcriptional regulator [Geminocystis sp. GBBB08]|uniref:LysR family transcriptional regulator n=1 Tax=Geminocystis sp. GBBB08 TaxID=2604140 RepID=UPI0027E29DAD|nr:LysR family transcriptional regulator [Geminocystis sp. GBBB08]MBL1208619.1 LysR family transcriptional regulator [Geminocystis sp. GBBB08]